MPRGNGNSGDVVDGRPEEVLLDFTAHAPGEHDRARNIRRVVFYQYDVGRFNRHVGAGADGYADFRLRQSRRVIHAVTNHRHFAPFALQLRHLIRFVFRQDFGDNRIDSELSRDAVSRVAVVARQHYRLHAGVVQESDRLPRAFSNHVCDGDYSGGPSVHRDVHRGFRVPCQLADFRFQVIQRYAFARHQPGVADVNAPPVNLRFNTVTGYGVELLRRDQVNAALACARDNRFG